jgi:hypothetical protein
VKRNNKDQIEKVSNGPRSIITALPFRSWQNTNVESSGLTRGTTSVMKSIEFGTKVYDLPYVAHTSTSGYIDLRGQPARIDELPELREELRLKSLVSLLNDPSGMFMTHACGRAHKQPGTEHGVPIRIPYGAMDAPCWYSSYVVFSFWYLHQNQKEHYEAIYGSYPSDRSQSNVGFELGPVYFWTPAEQKCGFVDGSAVDQGSVCTLWVSGWGHNAKEADDRWSSGIDDLIAFFTKSPVLDLAAATGITVSQHMFGRSNHLVS